MFLKKLRQYFQCIRWNGTTVFPFNEYVVISIGALPLLTRRPADSLQNDDISCVMPRVLLLYVLFFFRDCVA